VASLGEEGGRRGTDAPGDTLQRGKEQWTNEVGQLIKVITLQMAMT